MDDDDELFDVTFDIIEFFLNTCTNIDIQYFDCRDLDEDESILMVSCAKDVDHSIYRSFEKINQIRDKKLELLKVFLFNVCKIEKPYNDLIAEYVWSGHYDFKYNEQDYNEITGEYC